MSKTLRPVDIEYTELNFVAQQETCEVCSSRLWITQHRERGITRLDGHWVLVLKDRRCPVASCPGRDRVYRAAEELTFALKGDLMGLDVLFEIGRRRLEDHMSFARIHRLLKDRGVSIGERSVSNAFERFLALTSCGSGESEILKEKFRKQGGIVLLIDGVQFDNHSPVLYVVSDAISHETLFAERHDSRTSPALQALLERVKKLGIPVLGIVSDKEKGLVPAIKAVFPNVPHQYCQFHFVKRCASALDRPLADLNAEVDAVGKEIRDLRRTLEMAPAPSTKAEEAEREVAKELLHAAHAATKVSGRAPFEPTALKRHERLLDVAQTASRAKKKKGDMAALDADCSDPDSEQKTNGVGK